MTDSGSDIDGFAVADPDGTFLTLSRDEARRLLALMSDEAEDAPFSPALESLRIQLQEWFAEWQ